MTINVLMTKMYLCRHGEKTKNSAYKGASSAQHCHFNSPMKSLEDSNVLLWCSPVALVLFKIRFSRLTGLVQCQCVHYLFSLQEFITFHQIPDLYQCSLMRECQGHKETEQPLKQWLLSNLIKWCSFLELNNLFQKKYFLPLLSLFFLFFLCGMRSFIAAQGARI